MSLTPLDIRKMDFPRKMRGLDPQAVEDFLLLAAEELATRLEEIARLKHENQIFRQRLGEASQRQQQLQEALLHAQKLSKDITDNAKREAAVLVKEAAVTSDNIVNQAIEQANRIESKISELRALRRQLQLSLNSTLEHFQATLEADVEDERTTATVRTLPRHRQQPS